MQRTLDQEIALVTGASRGIGKAIALALGRQGATVIGTATTDSGAQTIQAALQEKQLVGAGKTLNVTDAESVAGLLTSINKEFGAPTILVNNAGITKDNLVMRMKDEDWDGVIDTNLNSIFRMCKACLRGMLKAKYGRIINIASVVGLTGNPGQANYVSAKAGMIGFTKSLAMEVGSRGITVNSVAPGFIDTDMTRQLPEDRKQHLLGQIPLGRLGTPAEVAAVVVFLASREAGYITGETININGGIYMA